MVQNDIAGFALKLTNIRLQGLPWLQISINSSFHVAKWWFCNAGCEGRTLNLSAKFARSKKLQFAVQLPGSAYLG